MNCGRIAGSFFPAPSVNVDAIAVFANAGVTVEQAVAALKRVAAIGVEVKAKA